MPSRGFVLKLRVRLNLSLNLGGELLVQLALLGGFKADYIAKMTG